MPALEGEEEDRLSQTGLALPGRVAPGADLAAAPLDVRQAVATVATGLCLEAGRLVVLAHGTVRLYCSSRRPHEKHQEQNHKNSPGIFSEHEKQEPQQLTVCTYCTLCKAMLCTALSLGSSLSTPRALPRALSLAVALPSTSWTTGPGSQWHWHWHRWDWWLSVPAATGHDDPQNVPPDPG